MTALDDKGFDFTQPKEKSNGEKNERLLNVWTVVL